MDAIKLLSNSTLIEPKGLKEISKGSQVDMDEEKKKEVAKNFESILVQQLLSVMKTSVTSSGLLEDQGSKQMQDMFYSFLGEEVGNKGQLGLWKDIYASMSETKQPDNNKQVLDKMI